MTNMQWLVKNLQEVCKKIKAGGTPRRGIEKYWGGEIPFVKIEDIVLSQHFLRNTKETITEKGLENSNAWLIPTNSVLFSIYASIGEVAINKRPVATNQAILGIIPNKKMIDYRFLYYTLKKFGKTLIHRNIQSTQKNLTLEIVKNLKISLPPLSIQQKIVKILDTIQEAIEIQEKIIETTKELKKSVTADLFKYGAPSFRKGRRLKKTEIGEMPEDWEVVEAQDFCKFITDGTHDTPKPSKSGYYLITSKNLKEGKIDFTNAYKINKKDFEEVNKRSKVDKYDVLFGMIGTIGSPVLVLSENPNFAIKNVGLFKTGKDYIKGLYLVYYLSSQKAENFIKGNMRRTTQVYLTLGLLRKFLIPTPKSRKELQEIAQILQTIDQKIELEQKQKELYEELFKTMLRKIMNQEIDVESIKLLAG